MNNPDSENSHLGFEELQPDLRMQADLALRFYGFKKESITRADLDASLLKWAGTDNNTFSRNFRDSLERNPEIIALYESDPERALSQMEDLIYEKAAV